MNINIIILIEIVMNIENPNSAESYKEENDGLFM